MSAENDTDSPEAAMAIDTTRKGEQVRNVLTGRTGVIEYHSDGYNGEQDHYLVTLDETGAYGITQDWWKPEHIATRGRLGEIAAFWCRANVAEEVDEIIGHLSRMTRMRRSIEQAADELELWMTALEFEYDGGARESDAGVLRAVVRTRLTPDRMVEIPGLGRSVPVYS